MTLPAQELSTPEPKSLSEWFESAHNLSALDAHDQAGKMTAFFTALTITHAPSKTTANLN